MAKDIPPAPNEIEDDFEKKVMWYLRFTGHQEFKEIWDFTADDCLLRVESMSQGPPASISYRFVVTLGMCGSPMNLHGGCAATLVDNLTNVVIVAASPPGTFSNSGISRNLRVTFLRPLPLGTDVRAICKIVNIGQRLVLVKTEFFDVKSGRLCLVGEHEKVNMDRNRESKV